MTTVIREAMTIEVKEATTIEILEVLIIAVRVATTTAVKVAMTAEVLEALTIVARVAIKAKDVMTIIVTVTAINEADLTTTEEVDARKLCYSIYTSSKIRFFDFHFVLIFILNLKH